MLDQPPRNAITGAIQWLNAILFGTIGTTIAVIAVASIGLLLLSGRIDVRRGVKVLFGCFILFGATSIASGLAEVLLDGQSSAPPAILSSPPPPPAPVSPSQPGRQMPYDPYAGASLPSR